MRSVDPDEFIDWFQKWSEKKLVADMNIKEYLALGDFSFWWFLDFYLFNNFQRRMGGQAPGKSALKIYLAPSYILARTLLRKIYGRSVMAGRAGKQADVLILSHKVNWKNGNVPPYKNEDQIFQPVFDELKNRDIRFVAIDRNQDVGLRLLREKEKNNPGDWIPIETFLTAGDIMEAIEANRRLRKKYLALKKSAMYRKSLKFKGKNMARFFDPVVELALSYTAMEAMLQIRALDRIVELTGAKCLVLSHEYGTFGKAPLIVAHDRNIKTLAVQHGVIHPYHMGYIHTPDEIGEWGPTKCPMPDKMAVFGKFTADFLKERGNFPDDIIEVIGQPKYDVLSSPEKVFDRESFRRKNGIGPDEYAVLVATQSLPLIEERELFFKNVMRLARVSGVKVIIKPHPGENPGWHKARLERMGVRAVVLGPRSNIFEAIYSTDMLATFNSTVATEAILMDRDVLILNLTGNEDIIPYVTDGAAIGVYRKEDIVVFVRNLLADGKQRAKLRAGRKKFIQHHFHSIDGNSTGRFCDLIKSMLK